MSRYAIIAEDGLSLGSHFPPTDTWDTGEAILHDDFSAKRSMYVLTHRMPDMVDNGIGFGPSATPC